MKPFFAKSLLTALLSALLLPCLYAGNYENFEVALYCRVYEVQKMKDPTWLQAGWDTVSRCVFRAAP